MVSLSPSTTFSSLSLFFHGPVSPGRFCLSSPRHTALARRFSPPPRSLPPPAPFCHSEHREESVFPPARRPALLVLFPPLSPLFFVLSLLPSSRVRSALFRPFLCFFCHILAPAPYPPPQWPLATPASWPLPVTPPPSPKKRFFEGISALFLSEIPLILVVLTSLQNIYFYKYILLYNNYLYARKHCTPWRSFSRGWRGVFARALFQGSARAPKRLFVGVLSAPEWPEWPDGWARTGGGAQKRDGKQILRWAGVQKRGGKQILRWAGALLRMTERGSE